MPMHIFHAVLEAGIPFDTHASDLYIPVTEETTKLLEECNQNGSVFTSNIDGKPWYDIPFAYLPWWEEHGNKNR